MKRKCGTCRFFVDGPPTHCRRMPPVRTGDLTCSYPVTVKGLWCGEHRYSVWRLLSGNRVRRATAAGDDAGANRDDTAVGK